jgi:hypothetical protein
VSDVVSVQKQTGAHARKCDRSGIIVEVHQQYTRRMDGRARPRQFLRKIQSFVDVQKELELVRVSFSFLLPGPQMMTISCMCLVTQTCVLVLPELSLIPSQDVEPDVTVDSVLPATELRAGPRRSEQVVKTKSVAGKQVLRVGHGDELRRRLRRRRRICISTRRPELLNECKRKCPRLYKYK